MNKAVSVATGSPTGWNSLDACGSTIKGVLELNFAAQPDTHGEGL
jgi:hypothetical protein